MYKDQNQHGYDPAILLSLFCNFLLELYNNKLIIYNLSSMIVSEYKR